MGVEQSALHRRGDGDEAAGRPLPGLPVYLGGERVGIGARPRDHATGRLGGERGPQKVFRVEVGAPVPGGVGRRDGDELPCGAAQQTAVVDTPRVGRLPARSGAEKVREEVSEGVRTLVLWTLLSFGHGYPSPWSGRTGPRCLSARAAVLDAVPQVRRDHGSPQPHWPQFRRYAGLSPGRRISGRRDGRGARAAFE